MEQFSPLPEQKKKVCPAYIFRSRHYSECQITVLTRGVRWFQSPQMPMVEGGVSIFALKKQAKTKKNILISGELGLF